MHTPTPGQPSPRDDERITADIRPSCASENVLKEGTTTRLPMERRAIAGTARESAGHPGAGGTSLVVSCLGILSLIDSLAAIACLLIGPFTCFLTWGLAYYVLLIGLPFHILALLTAVAAPGRPRSHPEGLVGAGFALAAGLLGTALAGGVLWIVHGLWAKP